MKSSPLSVELAPGIRRRLERLAKREGRSLEAQLARHQSVAKALVLLRENHLGDKRLVGYVVPRRNRHLTASELRSYLAERLPEYMTPSNWVMLDEIPLTSNGKVDTGALPEIETLRPGRDEKRSQRSLTTVEQMIAGIWEEVLGVAEVGLSESFFEIGGHSLLATQVISRVRRAFDIKFPLRSLFQAPTVEGMAESVEQALAICIRRARANDVRAPGGGAVRDVVQ